MGFRRKEFDKENICTDESERSYKKKKRKKQFVGVQISELGEIQEGLNT